jgi:hypothetical protein
MWKTVIDFGAGGYEIFGLLLHSDGEVEDNHSLSMTVVIYWSIV